MKAETQHDWIMLHDWIFVLRADFYCSGLFPCADDEQFYRRALPVARAIAISCPGVYPTRAWRDASLIVYAVLSRCSMLRLDAPSIHCTDTRVDDAVTEYRRISSVRKGK